MSESESKSAGMFSGRKSEGLVLVVDDEPGVDLRGRGLARPRARRLPVDGLGRAHRRPRRCRTALRLRAGPALLDRSRPHGDRTRWSASTPRTRRSRRESPGARRTQAPSRPASARRTRRRSLFEEFQGTAEHVESAVIDRKSVV